MMKITEAWHDTQRIEARSMKYQVTYRLLHPAYIPVTRTSPIDVATRAEMLARLAGLIDKWRSDGYTIYVLNIAPMRDKRRRRA